MASSTELKKKAKSGEKSNSGKKRKLDVATEIEIDLQAAEPPSKKAKRKAEKLSKLGGTVKSKDPVQYAINGRTVDSEEAHKPGKTPGQKPVVHADHGVWIGNLSFTTTKDDLFNFFTTKSDITTSQISRINLPTSESDRKETHRHRVQNKGFAYIDFDSAETLAKALKLTETLLGGRKVLIKDSSDFGGRPKKPTDETEALIESSTKAGHPPNRRVFVGNLSFDTTQQDIRDHLGQCGEITKIDLCTFEDSGKCKGFGFVDFKDLAAAINAVRGWIEVEGDGNDEVDELPSNRRPRRKSVKVLNGRPIRFQFAEDSITRYKKRYRTGIKENGKVVSINSLPEDHVGTVKPSVIAQDASVAHRTGQIMESKGQKTTFS